MSEVKQNIHLLLKPFSVTHHSHQSSSHTNQRAHCNDHQSQLPPTHETNHEAKHKRREPLNEDRHLISNGTVDLVDITEKEQSTSETIKHSHNHTLITAWSVDRGSQLTLISVCSVHQQSCSQTIQSPFALLFGNKSFGFSESVLQRLTPREWSRLVTVTVVGNFFLCTLSLSCNYTCFHRGAECGKHTYLPENS